MNQEKPIKQMQKSSKQILSHLLIPDLLFMQMKGQKAVNKY